MTPSLLFTPIWPKCHILERRRGEERILTWYDYQILDSESDLQNLNPALLMAFNLPVCVVSSWSGRILSICNLKCHKVLPPKTVICNEINFHRGVYSNMKENELEMFRNGSTCDVKHFVTQEKWKEDKTQKNKVKHKNVFFMCRDSIRLSDQ